MTWPGRERESLYSILQRILEISRTIRWLCILILYCSWEKGEEARKYSKFYLNMDGQFVELMCMGDRMMENHIYYGYIYIYICMFALNSNIFNPWTTNLWFCLCRKLNLDYINFWHTQSVLRFNIRNCTNAVLDILIGISHHFSHSQNRFILLYLYLKMNGCTLSVWNVNKSIVKQ